MTVFQTQHGRHRLWAVPLMVGTLLLAAGCTNDEDASTAQEDTSGEQISMSEVEDNDSAESCWAVIDDTVYDLTDWVLRHPGGADRIEQLCGTDATELFTQQHGGDPRPEGELENFEIGTLQSE